MLGEAAALTAAACWAVGSHLYGRIGRNGEVPPGAMNLGKCLTAAALSGLTVVVLTGRVWPDAPPAAIGWLMASGVVGLALGDGAYFGAIVTIGVRRAVLLLSTAPVFAAVGGAIWLRERLGLLESLGVGAVLAGVVLVVYERTAPRLVASAPSPVGEPGVWGLPTELAALAAPRPPARLGPPSALGVLLGVGAGVGQAAGSLMSRAAMARNVTAIEASFVRLCAGVIGILVLAVVTRRLRAWVRVLSDPPTLGRVAASAVLGSYIGIWLAQFAIANASSTAVASTLLATTPIFALPLGRWLEAERITARAVAGTLLAVAGLAALSLAPSLGSARP